MIKKPKPQALRERVEKTSSTDEVDPQWQDHFTEVAKALASLGPIDDFNLLDRESAQRAYEMCSQRLAALNAVSKRVKAVKTLAEQKRAEALSEVNRLPWPETEEN